MIIFDATVQTCIFDLAIDGGGTEREGSGRRRLLASDETAPEGVGRSVVACDCDAAGLNETREARQELAALTNEVTNMKAAHSVEITGLKDELRREIEAGREESRRAHEETQRAQAQTRELLLQLLDERNR